jgi:hypothetical protein
MLLATREARPVIAAILALAVPTIAGAQARVIRVVSSDGQPVAYANVSVEGGLTQITDEKGDVSLGPGKRQTFTVNGTEIKSPLALTGFYDRWLMRQKGVLSAIFISPEELEFRHPERITGMLYGLNGVQVSRGCVTAAPHSRCVQGPVPIVPGCGPMAIVIDGQQQFPPQGANVDIDMLLDASDVAAIEVYARGGNMPVSFQFVDTKCGVVAFWTGSRRP